MIWLVVRVPMRKGEQLGLFPGMAQVHVASHSRRTKSGKVSQVHAHQRHHTPTVPTAEQIAKARAAFDRMSHHEDDDLMHAEGGRQVTHPARVETRKQLEIARGEWDAHPRDVQDAAIQQISDESAAKVAAGKAEREKKEAAEREALYAKNREATAKMDAARKTASASLQPVEVEGHFDGKNAPTEAPPAKPSKREAAAATAAREKQIEGAMRLHTQLGIRHADAEREAKQNRGLGMTDHTKYAIQEIEGELEKLPGDIYTESKQRYDERTARQKAEHANDPPPSPPAARGPGPGPWKPPAATGAEADEPKGRVIPMVRLPSKAAPPAAPPPVAPEVGPAASPAEAGGYQPPRRSQKLVAEIEKMIDDHHEDIRDTAGWGKQVDRLMRADKKARDAGEYELSDWLEKQKGRLYRRREHAGQWRRLVRDVPNKMDPIDYAISVLDRGPHGAERFADLPKEIQDEAHQKRNAKTWTPGVHNLTLPHYGEVKVSVRHHDDRKYQHPRNQYSATMEWTDKNGRRASATHDPFEQEGSKPRWRMDTHSSEGPSDFMSYEVHKALHTKAPVPPDFDPEVTEGSKMDWIPYFRHDHPNGFKREVPPPPNVRRGDHR